MKLLCTHSYYARHHQELAEFVKNPERDIVLISDTVVSKPPSFDYFVIDSDAGNQIASFHANLNTYFVENNHQLATEVQDGVNAEVRQTFLNIPQFLFKQLEEDK